MDTFSADTDMEINTTLTSDTLPPLLVIRTESVVNRAGTIYCRFVCELDGHTMLADFSPDDEGSDVSLIEAVGSGDRFNTFLNLVTAQHRDRLQAWCAQHRATA